MQNGGNQNFNVGSLGISLEDRVSRDHAEATKHIRTPEEEYAKIFDFSALDIAYAESDHSAQADSLIPDLLTTSKARIDPPVRDGK